MPHTSPSPLRIAYLRQRLRDLGAKPCHEDRLLRGWSQVCSYDRKHSPAEDFFPLALRNELPAIEAELHGLARLKSEYAVTALSTTLSPRKPSPHPSPASGRGGKCEKPCSIPVREGADVARLLVELHDGQMVESVLLPRSGLCVSTQVGCAVGCVFCMSGRDGLLRQLGSAEIVAQVVLARRRRAVSKVVFMGMGEPAHNLDNVLEAIELLGTYGNIGHKNLVLSTVGDVRVFERLMQGMQQPRSPIPPLTPPLKVGERSGLSASHPPFQGEGWGGDGVNPADGQSLFSETVKPALAISLHSTDAALRARLLPHAPQIAIEELVERAEVYARASGYPIQYQWTLLAGVNDSDAELKRIAQLLAGKYAVMNFIPFNDVNGLDYRRPCAERIAAMAHTLNRQGIYTRVRDSAGQKVKGACGQLRARAVEV